MASITVVGTGFTGATLCFFGSVGVTISLNAAGTSFTCIPPAGVAGPVTIGITGSGGTVQGSGDKGYTYMASPTTSALGTTMGPIAGGTSVVITGTNFYNRQFAPNINEAFPGVTLPVAFGATASTGGFINSTTQVTVLTPAFATVAGGTVSVNLNTPTGTASTQTYTYIAQPTLTTTSFGPTGSSGPLGGGTQLRIIGTNLSTTSGVTMGGSQGATLQVIEAAGVTLLSPPSSTAGIKSIIVTTAGGTASGVSFTYVAPPSIVSISPQAGPLTAGTVVTITSSNSTLQNPTFVFFGITQATNLVGNATGNTAFATTPAGSAGTVDVGYYTVGGGNTLGNAFTYVITPTITSVTPNRGPTGGG
jgi:IPT/TIG domain